MLKLDQPGEWVVYSKLKEWLIWRAREREHGTWEQLKTTQIVRAEKRASDGKDARVITGATWCTALSARSCTLFQGYWAATGGFETSEWHEQVCVLERVLRGQCKQWTLVGKPWGMETSLRAVREIQLRENGISRWGSGSWNRSERIWEVFARLHEYL